MPSTPKGTDAALVEAFFRDRHGPPGIMTGALMKPGDASQPFRGTALNPDTGVVYIETGGLDLRGAAFTRPTIILDDQTASRAVARFGNFYPYSFKSVIRSADGKKVFFWYSEQWRGGQVHAELVNGQWKITVLSEWVS